MNDKQIFECMAKKTGIRAVEIADMLDVDLSDVSDALKALVDEGDVVRSSGFSPNGLPTQLYDFSEQFMRSNEYKSIMAASTPVEAAVAATAPSPAPAPMAKVGEVPSRAERAIAHILKTGGATDVELRELLVMRQEEYPSSILGHAMKIGRVTRVNNRWVPGDGRPVMAPVKAKPFSIGKSTPAPAPAVPQFLADRVSVPVKPNGGAGKPKKATPAPVAEPVVDVAEPPVARPLRCGVWSDGVVELQRGSLPIALLSKDEADFMAAFLARVGVREAA